MTIYYIKEQPLTFEEEIQSKVILCLGESGAGKTTLIDSLVNTLIGVELEDKFRYRVLKNFFKNLYIILFIFLGCD